MRVKLNFPWPVTGAEISTVNRLIDEGSIKDGGELTPPDLARLLGCEHLNGERACGNCLGAD
jgi:hypothetical protein